MGFWLETGGNQFFEGVNPVWPAAVCAVTQVDVYPLVCERNCFDLYQECST